MLFQRGGQILPSTSAASVTGQQPFKCGRNRPFVCSSEGCTAAYKHQRHLRAHEATKHGRKKRKVKGALNKWIAANRDTPQTINPLRESGQDAAGVASPIQDYETSPGNTKTPSSLLEQQGASWNSASCQEGNLQSDQGGE